MLIQLKCSCEQPCVESSLLLEQSFQKVHETTQGMWQSGLSEIGFQEQNTKLDSKKVFTKPNHSNSLGLFKIKGTLLGLIHQIPSTYQWDTAQIQNQFEHLE
jgi:hypothetical protein